MVRQQRRYGWAEGSIIEVEGRAAIVEWDGRPEHHYVSVIWDDTGEKSDIINAELVDCMFELILDDLLHRTWISVVRRTQEHNHQLQVQHYGFVCGAISQVLDHGPHKDPVTSPFGFWPRTLPNAEHQRHAGLPVEVKQLHL